MTGRAVTGCRRAWAPARLPAAVLVAALVAGGLLAGCTSARNDLGTADSQCYVAIPAAISAVHGVGRLEGVRLVNLGTLRERSPVLYRAAEAVPGRRTQSVCLVAFAGDFRAGRVTRPVGERAGRLAVVALGFPDNHVLATLVAGRSPLPFGHSHIGLL